MTYVAREFPESAIVTSTMIIPADTTSTEPIFLTNTSQSRCQSGQLGCTFLGEETQDIPQPNTLAFSHANQYLPNQPDAYVFTGQVGGTAPAGTQGTLCRREAVGCAAFASECGTSFFKDPVITGQSICDYRKNIDYNGGKATGWFLSGIGHCAANQDTLCVDSSGCPAGDTCDTDAAVPCYTNNRELVGGSIIYDLSSNDALEYGGLVGSCPATENSCTELVDPSDRTDPVYPNGLPYYVLFQSIAPRQAECTDGTVSLVDGCVLFDRTSDPRKLFDSTATYALSETASPPFAPVSPVSSLGNDANLILKVDRDRACAEWLSCKSSYPARDAEGNVRNLCYEYKSCTAAETDVDPGGRCTSRPGTAGLVTRLTEQNYIARGTGANNGIGWNDLDYSGYALYDKYQVDDLRTISFDLTTFRARHQNLTVAERAAYDAIERTSYLVYDRAEYAFECGPDDDWISCGGINLGGRCYAQRCIYPLGTPFPSDTELVPDNVLAAVNYLVGGTCKAFPENSPFRLSFDNSTDAGANLNAQRKRLMTSVKTASSTEAKSGFSGANVSLVVLVNMSRQYKNGDGIIG